MIAVAPPTTCITPPPLTPPPTRPASPPTYCRGDGLPRNLIIRPSGHSYRYGSRKTRKALQTNLIISKRNMNDKWLRENYRVKELQRKRVQNVGERERNNVCNMLTVMLWSCSFHLEQHFCCQGSAMQY